MIKTETNHLWNLENENNKMCISNKINIQSDVFQQLMYFYTLAIKEIETKIEAINKKYSQYHLVDHLKTRIKEPKSILEKMRKKSYELTYENLIGKVNDIAGIRIICPLKNNLYIIKSL